MENEKDCKVIDINRQKSIDSLIAELDELTDPDGIHFSQEIFDEKDELRAKILSGQIVINED